MVTATVTFIGPSYRLSPSNVCALSDLPDLNTSTDITPMPTKDRLSE